MFKHKSPLGKENMISEWFLNEQVKVGMSPIKNQTIQLEPSFSKVIKNKNVHPQRNIQPTPHQPIRYRQDHLDLECNQTLQFCNLEQPKKKTSAYELENSLLCDEQLGPLQHQHESPSPHMVARLETLLNKYMYDHVEMRKRIRELQNQLQQRNNRREDLPFNRNCFRK